MESARAAKVQARERFEFGANWTRFLAHVDDKRIRQAEESLRAMLGVPSLTGRRFLDIGSGSGLFSLAAHRLGAIVHSFDFDPKSVACTAELRRRYAQNSSRWIVEAGSVLDPVYLAKLGKFDVVYSWGVLHHTGNMQQAFENTAQLVAPGGLLFIAIYNDQGWKSRYWREMKRLYNSNIVAHVLLSATHAPVMFGGRFVVRALTGRLREERGMSFWYDFIDWMGGYPFEVASVAALRAYFEPLGFELQRLRDVGRRSGCNELVLRRT